MAGEKEGKREKRVSWWVLEAEAALEGSKAAIWLAKACSEEPLQAR